MSTSTPTAPAVRFRGWSQPIPFTDARFSPSVPGLYRIFSGRTLVYVGQSVNLRHRLMQHLWCLTHLRVPPEVLGAYRFRVLPVPNQDALRRLQYERRIIERNRASLPHQREYEQFGPNAGEALARLRVIRGGGGRPGRDVILAGLIRIATLVAEAQRDPLQARAIIERAIRAIESLLRRALPGSWTTPGGMAPTFLREALNSIAAGNARGAAMDLEKVRGYLRGAMRLRREQLGRPPA